MKAGSGGKGPSVDVEVRGAQAAAIDLLRLGIRARDLGPVSRQIQTVFLHGEERRFATRASGTWPPLAQATLDKKAQLGQSSAVLRATDRLYRSLTRPGGSDQIKVVLPGQLRFGTNVEYAHFQLGTSTSPARPPIGLRPSDLRTISKIIAAHITGEPTL